MEAKTTIDLRIDWLRGELAKAFPEMGGKCFYLDGNKFGLTRAEGISVEFCYCDNFFVGHVETKNPNYDPLDDLDSESEDYDVDPWLTICRSSYCPTLAEAIASLKEAISSHAKEISLESLRCSFSALSCE
jgi:hypothetical protein